MKNFLKLMLVPCLILTFSFCLTACHIGTVTIKLDYGIGRGYVNEVNHLNGDTVSSLPNAAAPLGFSFDCWCYDKDLTVVASLPITAGNYTLYARYIVDENFNFIQTYHVGVTTLSSYTFNTVGTYDFLLKDQTGLQNLSSIEITSTLTSNFVCEKLTLLDKYGKEIENNTWFPNQWTSKTEMDATGIYIIRISVQSVGDAKISFSYNNT